ncbi:26S proteasome non-ATPase regulatory subunit 9 isoform X2 [Tachypleus tridentatus]|uniref:26S proteasome non-ATPase regulatory subunit 9 isoform X2 n=1 Tax=Tachypleus tridentatus TaxID=6853 RepID=UPI003FCFBE72
MVKMTLSTEVMRENLLTLIKKKDDIEKEISSLNEILKSQKNVGMNEPLIDKDDYPRGDIDVYKVRSARQKIICLQNDHKNLMKEIEEGLFSLHAKEKVRQETTVEAVDLDNFQGMNQLKPFVKIDRVDTGSPSHTAKTIVVEVMRDSKLLSLSLKPQSWSGQGVLGCSIVPIK